MDTVTTVQTLDEAVFISNSTHTLMKGMNPTTLPPAMGKIVGQTGQPIWEKENSEFKPVKLCLEIDIALRSARTEGFVNINIGRLG